ncbi:MAG: SulP family inorganic anion transporter [Candidatus Sedimenticola endophacoides]
MSSIWNTFLDRITPFLLWFPLVNRQTLKSDLSAGLTGAVVVLPQSVAFSSIAGMPPEYGLYAGMIPAIFAALFGSSWHLVSGPTTAASVVLFSSLSALAEPGSAHYVTLALTLTFMVGIIELTLGFARLGALVSFISHSVIVGFTAGAALHIIGAQLKNFFGISIPRGGHLYDTVAVFGQNIDQTNLYVFAVAMATVISGYAIKRFIPKFPYMIGAMLFGGLVAYLLNIEFGEATTLIPTVGALPQSLPPLSAPDLSHGTIKELAPAALAVTLFALTEAVSIGRSMAARSGQRIDGNQEFIGQGFSNLAGSFFSGYVATGSFNRSGLNYQIGAKTPLAAIFAGLLLMVVVLLVAPLTVYLPNAAMAGILFMVAIALIDFKAIQHIIHSSRREAIILGVTFTSTIFLDLELAIFAGVLLSLLLYLEKTSKPKILAMAPDPTLPKNALSGSSRLQHCPQLRIARIDGSLFFGSINHIQEYVANMQKFAPEQKYLAIIAEGINFADIAGCEALARVAHDLRKKGGDLFLIQTKSGLWEPLDKSGYLDEIGANNVFQSKTAAIKAMYQKLDKAKCENCEARIFQECKSVNKDKCVATS